MAAKKRSTSASRVVAASFTGKKLPKGKPSSPKKAVPSRPRKSLSSLRKGK